MRKLSVILIIILTSCDSFFSNSVHKIDSEIIEYYDIFIKEGIKRGVDYSNIPIIIEFGNLKDAQGTSKKRIDKVVHIIIDRDNWNKLSNTKIYYNTTKKEVTIMHELGHGILKRGHSYDCMSVMKTLDYCKYSNYYYHGEKMIDDEDKLDDEFLNQFPELLHLIEKNIIEIGFDHSDDAKREDGRSLMLNMNDTFAYACADGALFLQLCYSCECSFLASVLSCTNKVLLSDDYTIIVSDGTISTGLTGKKRE